MITYGIGILPIILELFNTNWHVTHTWRADDSRAVGTFPTILSHLEDLIMKEPMRGYFLDTNKTILVV